PARREHGAAACAAAARRGARRRRARADRRLASRARDRRRRHRGRPPGAAARGRDRCRGAPHGAEPRGRVRRRDQAAGGERRMSLRRLGSIVVKELRQLRRDRLTFAMIVGIPTMQLVLFGYAINLDVRHLDAAVLDQAGTARSRELIAEMAATEVLDLAHVAVTPQQLDALLREGRISAALVVPPDFEERLEARDRPALQIIVDGSEQVIQAAARQLAAFPIYGGAGWTSRAPPIEVVNFYNPERRAAINTVPGL